MAITHALRAAGKVGGMISKLGIAGGAELGWGWLKVVEYALNLYYRFYP
jgi:hypothetical protein